MTTSKTVEEYQTQLTQVELQRSTMKEANKLARKNGTDKLPGWMLSNLGANIRRVKQMISEIADRDSHVESDTISGTINGMEWSLIECKEDDRIRFTFDGKPPETIRYELKRGGFRWSPTNSAWQRQLTANGIHAARYFAKQVLGGN